MVLKMIKNKDNIIRLVKEKFNLNMSRSGKQCYNCKCNDTYDFCDDNGELKFNTCLKCTHCHTLEDGYEDTQQKVLDFLRDDNNDFIMEIRKNRLMKIKDLYDEFESTQMNKEKKLMDQNEMIIYYDFSDKLNFMCHYKDEESYLNNFKEDEERYNFYKAKLKFDKETNRLFPLSKLFLINKNISEILQFTENKYQTIEKLPFDEVFINDWFIIPKTNIIIKGIMLFMNTKDDVYATIKLHDENNESLGKEYVDDLLLYLNIFGGDKTTENKVYADDDFRFFYNKKQTNYVRNYICNFLDFINNPEVELITVERTKEQNLKRIKRGKRPIPTIKNIRVSGKLKIYLDHINSNPDFKYTHIFDVRGHWRMLRSDKWKKSKGTKIWIPPYIKGKGIYVKKNYEVESSHNNRITKVKE